MAIDILILNTAAIDLRHDIFQFAEKLAGKGGLALCETKDMPDYTDQELDIWIKEGRATAGGPGNTAPLIVKSGLRVAIGADIGSGIFNGLDAPGRFFYDVMTENNVDMTEVNIHPDLPTGISFIHDSKGEDRGGLCYFPNANNDFDFKKFQGAVNRLEPKIVYYMYSGLSKRGDANEGRDLADFIKWCRKKGIITIIDSHTLTGDPQEVIDSGCQIDEYKLLEPVLPLVDLFFTSSDESKMIANTFGGNRTWKDYDEFDNNIYFLDFLYDKFCNQGSQSKLFGVTVSDGAYIKHASTNGSAVKPYKIQSAFTEGDVIDFVGAGDSFRAGLLTYIGHNLNDFKTGNLNYTEAVQLGNLFAARFIKAPLNDRYGNIENYSAMLKLIREI